MADYPTLATAAGTLLMVSTDQPATHDEAGFTTLLASMTEIGYVTQPGVPRAVRQFADVPILDGTTFTYPQNETIDPVNVGVVFQDEDAGQVIIDANDTGQELLTFVYRTPRSGGLYYNIGFVGYVTGYSPTFDAADTHVSADFTVKGIFDANKVGIVRWKDAAA